MKDITNLLSNYKAMRAVVLKNPEYLREIGEAFLANIKNHETYNAFIEVYEDEFRAQIENSIEHFKQKKPRKLEGLVVGIKDLFCYKGHKVTGGSKILEGFVAQITSTSIKRLLEAGAMIIGRQNCDEFGMGASNENSFYGPVKNGIAKDRVPGGSSGGSAVAVQMKMCHLSLGSDTGGSARQPASFCGIWGYRPSYGYISRQGLLQHASSFDTVGILANNPEEIRSVLHVIAGPDGCDNTLTQREVCSEAEPLNKSVEHKKKSKIAYLEDTLSQKGIQKEIKNATYHFLDKLRASGHQVEPIDFPLLEYVLPVYYVLTTAEASSNLAQYDGVRYGFRASETSSYEEMIQKTRTLGFGAEVKRRIILGTFILSAEQQDAYYRKAQKVRRKIKNALEDILKEYDYIILPTTTTTAPRIGAYEKNPLKNYLSDLYTVVAAVAGIPAISSPVGHDDNKLPIGIQVMSRSFEDDKLLKFVQNI